MPDFDPKRLAELSMKRSRPEFNEIGSTGLKRYGNTLSEEFLPQLKGGKAMKTFAEMEANDPAVRSGLFVTNMLLKQVSWYVEPVSQDNVDLAAAKFVEQCMEDMSSTWDDTISEILTMLPFGFSPLELVYKLRKGETNDPTTRSRFTDGRIGWRKMPLRAQDTIVEWLIGDDGGINGLKQTPPPSYNMVEIPIEKLLLFRTDTIKNNPEGRSILRAAYRPWYFKKRIEEIEGIGIERDLAGLPTVYAPAEWFGESATADQKQALATLKDIVINVRRDEQEGVLIPLMFDRDKNQLIKFELLSTGGKRQLDTDKVIRRYDQRILMTVLSDFLLLGHEKVGSYALSSDRTNLHAVAIGGWLKVIKNVFNRYAIPRLFHYNDMPVKELPTIEHGDVEKPNVDTIISALKSMSDAGMELFPDEKLEAWIRSLLGAPEKEDEE